MTNSSWDTVSLKKVSEKVDYGHTAKASSQDNGYKFLRITDIQDGCVDWNSVPNCTCPEEKVDKYLLNKGDIVFARTGATTGKSFLVTNPPENGLFASYLIRVRVRQNLLSPEFLALFFQSQLYWDQIMRDASGSAQPGVNATKLKGLVLPLPPLPEQKRIVEILDEAFEAIDKAIANTKRNIKNAEELFDSYLVKLFDSMKTEWPSKKLHTMCDFRNGFAFKSKLFREEGMPILRISSIQDGVVSDNRPVFTDPKDYLEDLSRYHVQDGDLLIAMSGATTGKVGFNKTGRIYLQNQRVGRFIPKDGLSLHYLYLYLRNKAVENLEISAGSAQPNLSTKQIKDFLIPVPSICIQNEITTKARDIEESLDELTLLTKRKKEALETAKQSILQKAFTGELTKDFREVDKALSEAGA